MIHKFRSFFFFSKYQDFFSRQSFIIKVSTELGNMLCTSYPYSQFDFKKEKNSRQVWENKMYSELSITGYIA